MRKPLSFLLLSLCMLALSACAGGNTGLALGYGHHGPGIAVYTDGLWATPHQAGVSVPMGWESGAYTQTPPPAPVAPQVAAPGTAGRLAPQALPPSPQALPAATPLAPAAEAGPLTGYTAPVQLPALQAKPAEYPEQSRPESKARASRLGVTPSVLIPPDLSYRP